MADRDANGRFTKGNQAAKGNRGGGRPCKAGELEWSELFQTAVARADFLEVVRVLVSEAKAGKAWAIKQLMAYLIGLPTQYVVNDDREITIRWVRE